MRRIIVSVSIALAGCSNERLARQGTLPDGDTFQDISRIGVGYERRVYAPDGRLKARQELLSEENFKRIEPGMTKEELADVIGVAYSRRASYPNGTSSMTWRYYDGIYKLLHVIFGPDDRVLGYETEWDPLVYSRGGGNRK